MPNYCYCKADPDAYFQPAARLIYSITSANPALVTTTFAHQYKTGLIVRLKVPEVCGMSQVNKQTYQITVIDATSFTIPVDATAYDPFLVLTPTDFPSYIDLCAWVIPVGEGVDYTDSAEINIKT
jgi:hypothetical protein